MLCTIGIIYYKTLYINIRYISMTKEFDLNVPVDISGMTLQQYQKYLKLKDIKHIILYKAYSYH
mgnify:CR=1 FL=1